DSLPVRIVDRQRGYKTGRSLFSSRDGKILLHPDGELLRFRRFGEPLGRFAICCVLQWRRCAADRSAIESHQMQRGNILILQDNSAEGFAAAATIGGITQRENRNCFQQIPQLTELGTLTRECRLAACNEGSLSQFLIVNGDSVLSDLRRKTEREKRNGKPKRNSGFETKPSFAHASQTH